MLLYLISVSKTGRNFSHRWKQHYLARTTGSDKPKIHSPDKKTSYVLRRKVERVFYLYTLQQKNISFKKSETYSNIVLFAKILCWSIFCGVTPLPNNRSYSSGKGFVKIVRIWHRDVQPGIVQSSNQIISRDRHDSNYLSAHKIQT